MKYVAGKYYFHAYTAFVISEVDITFDEHVYKAIEE